MCVWGALDRAATVIGTQLSIAGHKTCNGIHPTILSDPVDPTPGLAHPVKAIREVSVLKQSNVPLMKGKTSQR